MIKLKNISRGVQHWMAFLLIELPARRIGMDHLIERLEKSIGLLDRRILAASRRPRNQDILAHMIGIERWGQRHLRIALGESQHLEEYDAFRPSGKAWNELYDALRSSRQSTVRLSKSLRMAGVDPATPIPHNQFGEISLIGWLYYLNLHANIESLRFN